MQQSPQWRSITSRPAYSTPASSNYLAQKRTPGFTQKHDVTRLVYLRPFGDVRNAISREKQIKAWRRESREKKLALIHKMNPHMRDLSEDFPK
jgi:predicted GIY-YIG superfamily endonuclease